MLICHCDKCDRNCVNRKEPAESWKRPSAFTVPRCYVPPANRNYKTTDKYHIPSSTKHYENDLGEFLWCIVLHGNRGMRARAGSSLDQTDARWDCVSVPDTESQKAWEVDKHLLESFELLLVCFIQERTKPPPYSQSFKYFSTRAFELLKLHQLCYIVWSW